LCLTAKAFVAIRAPRIAARALNPSNGSERRCVSATTPNKGLDRSGCKKKGKRKKLKRKRMRVARSLRRSAAEKEDSMIATITAIVVKPVNPDREWEWPTTLEMSVTSDRRKDRDAALAIFRTISFE
jgi:hypothetical protein